MIKYRIYGNYCMDMQENKLYLFNDVVMDGKEARVLADIIASPREWKNVSNFPKMGMKKQEDRYGEFEGRNDET